MSTANATSDKLAPERWLRGWHAGWERFWFTPSPPHTLALLRILAGGMLLYTHLVWTIDFSAFFGPTAWVNNSTARLMNQSVDGTNFAFSHLWQTESLPLLWTMHVLALLVFAALFVGFYTRVSSVLACILTLSYCHRLAGTLFGLDQVNALFATYLMLGRCGDVWSVDHWLATRRSAGQTPVIENSVGTTIAIRLIQLHLCVIYIFGGLTKLRGDLWWDGSALWFAFASYEYQSLDMTWMVRWPALIAAVAHATIIWEVFYPAFAFNRQTRPIAIGMAILVHGGIAIALGMKTFGLAMIFANLSFLYPSESAWLVGKVVSLLRLPSGVK